MQDTNTNDLRNIISSISSKLDKNDIAAEIHYRLKDPCSVLKKILRKTITLKELTDLIAFRVIVDKKEDCYKVLAIIYSLYSINIKKSKNYIANPKDNGYRSLHVIVVVGIYERNIEIQIRSRRMHNIAESGTANHDKYKKKQEVKLRKLLSKQKINTTAINTEINNAYNIFRQFNWTIAELVAYEQAIENLCYNLYDDN
ncbi:MAG TPA: bifunctional (p)ppGpp synthetase/guanosine-3',5'-bis(diphosphate) 3'-pyrophosphohydrolase [Rickettsia endosymbiont of Sericostoma sp.]|uniref:bifunctional (p)ppGpp synthetase/guanosine-3',5'-bis(diphosphate) 3'-pyrophosphohydrolase n=2 Tax=unclassified Candidatus Tisiphia TaxID=2996318 RepID=UPI001D93EACC|nr:bifunctional (p)ppGpp synthetase/guanosine-3',5'-bis(diphosphate) 3'-pyrophosphohydrolase [Rickettsia endosymbiont of Sericostoma sp.]